MPHRIDADARKLLKLLQSMRNSSNQSDTVTVQKADLDKAVNMAINTLWTFESLRMDYPYGKDGTAPYGADGSSPATPES